MSNAIEIALAISSDETRVRNSRTQAKLKMTQEQTPGDERAATQDDAIVLTASHFSIGESLT